MTRHLLHQFLDTSLGYENAAIGFRFTKPGVNPDFRSAVEKEVNQLRAENPDINIIIEWK